MIVETQPVIDRLKNGDFEVPMLPEAATQVMALCSDSDCDVRALIESVKKDQALMAHVMRMANSALYAADVEIVSLQLAVSRIGLTTVRSLAAAAACKGAVFKPGRSKSVVQRLFKKALARGIFAQEIARVLRANVELAFMAGLMREIGSPVIVFEMDKLDVSPQELDEVVHDYRFQVGCVVLKNWGLPEKICQSVEFANRPEEAGELIQVVHTVELAEVLAEQLVSDQDLDEDRAIARCCQALNLYDDDLEKLVKKGEKIRDMVESLG